MRRRVSRAVVLTPGHFGRKRADGEMYPDQAQLLWRLSSVPLADAVNISLSAHLVVV